MQVLLVGKAGFYADIASCLKRIGHAVDWARDGTVADRFLSDFQFDLVVLDLLVPLMDGFTVLKRLRARRLSTTPVLILSAQPSVDEKVRALDMGADDYLPIPFDFREFQARARCLLRRRIGGATNELTCEQITLDLTARAARINGAPLCLTRRELSLLEILMAGHGRTFSKEFLLFQIYGHDSSQHENAVEVLVTRLRRKIFGSGAEITTHRCFGYSLSPESNHVPHSRLSSLAPSQLNGAAA
jgi:two-component system, OmpR family, response regulator TctD